jgi:16S rRNA G1207 methylase RsmC
MSPLDAYVNKTVPFKFKGAEMSFDLSHALFSSFDIDQGSRLLLKVVAKNVEAGSVASIVDIGSGVGVLGVASARGYPGASLVLRDRDALAAAFSERNARRNKVVPQAVETALFLDGIEGRRFDLVLCNVPAKAGPPVLDRFLRDVPGIVSERGYGAVVVVAPIAEAALQSLGASGAELVHVERGPGHTAALFRRGSAAEVLPGDSWAVLERAEQGLRAGKTAYRVKGYWGLPEFDTASYASELAMDLCENAMAGAMVRRAAVVNPGVGRAACYVQARARMAVVDLCGRDALALAAARRNLDLAAGPRPEADPPAAFAFSSALPDASYDLIVEFPDITPRVDTTDESWAAAARALKRGGAFVASMPSTAMDRFERRRPKGFTRLAERKKKGFACAAWRLDV